MEIRRALAKAVTPPTTPPAIAPLFEDEPLGLGDALDETEGLGGVPPVKENEDEVALETALETEEEVVTTCNKRRFSSSSVPSLRYFLGKSTEVHLTLSHRNYAEQYRALGGIAWIRASVAASQRCAISDCAGRAAEISAVVI